MRDTLGSWRWPRIVFGGVIDYCMDAQAICFGLPFSQNNPRYSEPHELLENTIREFGALACGCNLESSDTNEVTPPGLSRFFLDIENGPVAAPSFNRVEMPYIEMLRAAATMGFMDHHPDGDGVVRGFFPCAKVYDYWLPSLSLAGYFCCQDDPRPRVGWIDQGAGFLAGKNAFFCRPDGSILLRPSAQRYTRIPIADVFESIRSEIEGKSPSVARSAFVNKIVMIGSTASGTLGHSMQTPVPSLKDEIEISATALDNLLSGTHYYITSRGFSFIFILACSLFSGMFFRNRKFFSLITWPLGILLLFVFPTVYQFVTGGVLPVGAALAGSGTAALVVGTLIWSREQKLIRSITEAEATKQKLTDMLVHDLKNRLSPIMISLNIVRERTSVYEDHEVEELLNVAERAATGLLEQVHNLLDIRKMQEGHLHLNPSVFEIKDILHEEMRQYSPAARQAGLEIRCSNNPASPSVYADPNIVSRVLSNLISNALDYATTGSVVELDYKELEDGWISVSVSNQGKPIPPEEHERLFESFLGGKTKSLRSVTARGWGLGLAFCKLAVEEHGGRIWITSPLKGRETGVSLNFTLPPPAGPAEVRPVASGE
jgi:signal transduction histidine kinase